MEKIPIDDLKTGHIYKLNSRNLSYGVYDGDDGFIGIRTKFKNRYLFTEYHWDTEDHKPYGTVRTMEDTGIIVPNCIPLIEYHFQQYDSITGREIKYDNKAKRWRYSDDDDSFPGPHRSFLNPNLFKWMEEVEERLERKRVIALEQELRELKKKLNGKDETK